MEIKIGEFVVLDFFVDIESCISLQRFLIGNSVPLGIAPGLALGIGLELFAAKDDMTVFSRGLADF